MGDIRTVKELIDELKHLPQDAIVYVYGDCGAGCYGSKYIDVIKKDDSNHIEIWGYE